MPLDDPTRIDKRKIPLPKQDHEPEGNEFALPDGPAWLCRNCHRVAHAWADGKCEHCDFPRHEADEIVA